MPLSSLTVRLRRIPWFVVLASLIVVPDFYIAKHLRRHSLVRPETVSSRPFAKAPDCPIIAAPDLAKLPVSIAHWHDAQYLTCHYNELQLVNSATGAVHTLVPPSELPHWRPTGVCTIPDDGIVLVANYTGHDVLEMKLVGRRLTLLRRYVHDDMRSPENVALSPDRKLVGVADYDGNRLLVFHRDGSAAWQREVRWAHGVAFGADFVVVTSLQGRYVQKFDLRGQPLGRVGTMGWGDNKYLWPTSIHVDGDRLLVADAHTGKIATLDHQLRQTAWLGGNGPHPRLFNMPYAVGGQGREFMVCDTFNHRLLFFDHQFRCCRIVARAAAEQHQPDVPQEPAKIRDGYVNWSDGTLTRLRGLGSVTLLPGYGRYAVAQAPPAMVLHFPSSVPFNRGGFPYFCWCVSAHAQGDEYLLLGHSQSSWLLTVDAKGRCHASSTPQYLWAVNNRLKTSAGTDYDPTPNLNAARAAFACHDQQLAAGTEPLEALGAAFWSDLETNQLKAEMDGVFVSTAGKRFWKEWRAAQHAAMQAKAAERFDAALLQETSEVWLQELFLRNMLVPRN